MHDELALIILLALFLIALANVRRPSPQRIRVRVGTRPGGNARKRNSSVARSRRLDEPLRRMGMLAGTIGFLGLVVAPGGQPLWIALVVVAFAAFLATHAGPWINAVSKERARQAQSRSDREGCE